MIALASAAAIGLVAVVVRRPRSAWVGASIALTGMGLAAAAAVVLAAPDQVTERALDRALAVRSEGEVGGLGELSRSLREDLGIDEPTVDVDAAVGPGPVVSASGGVITILAGGLHARSARRRRRG